MRDVGLCSTPAAAKTIVQLYEDIERAKQHLRRAHQSQEFADRRRTDVQYQDGVNGDRVFLRLPRSNRQRSSIANHYVDHSDVQLALPQHIPFLPNKKLKSTTVASMASFTSALQRSRGMRSLRAPFPLFGVRSIQRCRSLQLIASLHPPSTPPHVRLWRRAQAPAAAVNLSITRAVDAKTECIW